MTLQKTLAIAGCVALGAALVGVDAKATPPAGATSVFIANLLEDPVPIDGVVDIATMPAVDLVGTRTHVAATAQDHVTLKKDVSGSTEYFRVHPGGFVENNQYVVPPGKALIVTDISYDTTMAGTDRYTFRLVASDAATGAVPTAVAMIVSATNFAHQEFPGGLVIGPGRRLDTTVTTVTTLSTENTALSKGMIHGYLVSYGLQPR